MIDNPSRRRSWCQLHKHDLQPIVELVEVPPNMFGPAPADQQLQDGCCSRCGLIRKENGQFIDGLTPVEPNRNGDRFYIIKGRTKSDEAG